MSKKHSLEPYACPETDVFLISAQTFICGSQDFTSASVEDFTDEEFEW